MKHEPLSHTKLLSALGLCKKAGKLILGTPMVCEALAGKHKPYLVLSASDNSENTQKKLQDKCAFYRVELIPLPFDGETLAAGVGKQAKLSAVAVTDENLCRLVRSAMQSK